LAGIVSTMMRYLIAAALLLACAGSAAAQQASSTNDPGQIERRIRERALPRPPAEAEISGPREPAAAEVPPLKVVLAGVAVAGASVFEPGEFAPLYEEFLAREIGAAEIEVILERITNLYRNRGYFLSRAVAPAQDIEGGVLRVRVIEGYVAAVFFEDARREQELRRYVRKIAAERPLKLATLERGVLLLNDVPGVGASASIRAQDEEAGAYELIIAVDEQTADGSFFFNNWGTDAVGPLQTWLSGGLNSPMGLGERLQAGVFTVPNQPGELLYGEIGYTHPVGRNGTYLSVTGSMTRVNEGDGSPIDSTSGRLALRGWHPLIRAQSQNLWLSGGFEYYNLDEDFDDETIARDKLRVLRAGLNYWLADDFRGDTFLAVELSQGLPVMGASRSGSDELTNPGGQSDFTKATLEASREQGLTEEIGVQVAVAGQKSLDRLLSSEQFGYGGSRFGRAYDFAEISGDDGVAGGMELRYGRDVALSWLQGYQLFAASDVGLVWNDVPGETIVRDSLASVGVGIRLTLPRNLLATVEVATALDAFDDTDGGGSRVSFSLSSDF
jgi:hemolysin activation/secretion protein